MDPEEKKQVQSIIDRFKGHFLTDGGEIGGSINSSSSEFAMNIIAHIVREYESGSDAYETETTRLWFIDTDMRQYLFDISLLNAVGYWCAVVVCKLSVFPVYLYISLAIHLLDSKVPPPPEAQYPYPNQYPYPYPYQYPNPPENLQQYFGHKRKDVAASLGVSVSTFKRLCKEQGINPWPYPYRKGSSGSVSKPPDQHGERNTSTLSEKPSHNVQPGMDGEPVGQNQEANVFRRDSMEGPIAMNTEVLRPPDQYEERNTSTACEAPPHNVQTGIEGESVGHSPACFTVQTLSPRPSARRTPAPTAEPSIPLEDRQQEENEASFMDTTSITYSYLSRLCEGMNIVQTDDILGGQGSAALWDYTIDSGMGEQNREVETREQPSPQRSPAADRGKGPANNEMEMPIRLFPLANQVEEVYHPLLNAIARAHPETFAHFNPQTPLLGPMLLRNLHDLLVPWARLRFDEFTLAKETAMQKLSQDLVRLGFDLGWLIARGSALRAAKERVALQPEIQSLSTLVESTRESLANLEARLAQAKRQDAELAAAALNLADLGPSELVFEELAS